MVLEKLDNLEKAELGISKMHESRTLLFRVAVASTGSVIWIENPESPRLLDWQMDIGITHRRVLNFHFSDT